MARRRRESAATGHTTPPIIVHEMNPIDDHPSLGQMERRKIKRLARKGKASVKVKVEVAAKTGGDDASS